MNDNQKTTSHTSLTTKLRKLVTKRRLVIFGIICLILLGIRIAIRPNSNQTQATLQNSVLNQTPADNRTDIQPAQAATPINKNFTFNITDNGQGVGKIDYYLDTAELRNQIIVKGEAATAVRGRTFLIINLKLKNDLKNPLVLNTRNFIRLSVDKEPREWLAPDIHNDPVEIQAISTKLSRLGFAISDKDTQFKLQVGEIGGDKTTIDLNF